MSIEFPYINPNVISIGPIAIKWYAIAYLVGILFGWFFVSKHLKLDNKQSEVILTYSILGVILGGRIGYILFYDLSYYIGYPLKIIKIWEGGMSFHGATIGLITALYLFSRKYNIKFLAITDLVVCTASLGIFLGRIANFINGELYGRITTVPWGIVFPYGGNLPRHPSQIYEALLEGLLLFIIMMTLFFCTKAKQYKGFLSGIWLILYGLSRIIIENFREPDEQLGYIFKIFTMGQILSIPLIFIGLILVLTRE